MTARASIYGRLVADPKPIQTKTGTAMTTGTMAVSLPTKDGEDATWWVNLLAFGRQAELLAGHHKGDMVSASGQLQMNRWTDQEGNTKESHRLLADSLISAKTVRPGRKSGSNQRIQAQQQNHTQDPPAHDDTPPFDDDMRF